MVTEVSQIDVNNEILNVVRGSSTPVMVFGSFARGDASGGSDIDALELGSRTSRPTRRGRVSVSVYDERTLRSMAERGALFVLHLLREGQIIRDPQGRLRTCLGSYRPPRSYVSLHRTMRPAANLLDATEVEYFQHWSGYNAVALFLLRTLLYARFAQDGRPTFSLDVIRHEMPREDLAAALDLKRSSVPAFDDFRSAVALVEEFLGHRVCNPFGTVEALITNKGLDSRLVLSLGLRILGREHGDLAYHL